MSNSEPDVNIPITPVPGYTQQSQATIDLVSGMKRQEEHLLRMLDSMAESQAIDQRWLAIGRTELEKAFMSINRSIFKPQRVTI